MLDYGFQAILQAKADNNHRDTIYGESVKGFQIPTQSISG